MIRVDGHPSNAKRALQTVQLAFRSGASAGAFG